jgi:hypothetical protein
MNYVFAANTRLYSSLGSQPNISQTLPDRRHCNGVANTHLPAKKVVVLRAIPCCRTVFWNIYTSVLRLFVEPGPFGILCDSLRFPCFKHFLFSSCSSLAKELPVLLLFFAFDWSSYAFIRSHFVRL